MAKQANGKAYSSESDIHVCHSCCQCHHLHLPLAARCTGWVATGAGACSAADDTGEPATGFVTTAAATLT